MMVEILRPSQLQLFLVLLLLTLVLFGAAAREVLRDRIRRPARV